MSSSSTTSSAPPPLLGGGACYSVHRQGTNVWKRVKPAGGGAALSAAIAKISHREHAETFGGILKRCSADYAPYCSRLLSVVVEQERSGDYLAVFEEGPTLQDVCTGKYEVPQDEAQPLVAALHECLAFLRARQGRMRSHAVDGDWALHNVVWNGSRIVNIDLEGFFTYPHYRPQIVNVLANIDEWFTHVANVVAAAAPPFGIRLT